MARPAALSFPMAGAQVSAWASWRLPVGVLAALLWMATMPAPVQAAPHQHGVAALDIAVDRSRISLRLDIPLDNLLGFEREPRTDAERSQAQAVLKQLNDVATLVRIDAAAGCSVSRVAVVSAELGVPQAGQAEAATSGHADLVADYEFTCTDTSKARAVTLGLFEAFPRLRRIEVQTATPRGQLKAVLARPNGRVALAR